MTWFVIYLAVHFGIGACARIARVSGWEPKPIGAGAYAFRAVVDALILAGILVWLL